jgi:hypothetical protein
VVRGLGEIALRVNNLDAMRFPSAEVRSGSRPRYLNLNGKTPVCSARDRCLTIQLFFFHFVVQCGTQPQKEREV